MGLNYRGTNNQLNGCINDTLNLKNFLVNNKFFLENELTLMNDDCKDELYPNKQNMLNAFESLVKFANDNSDKSNIYMFLSYSGHGAYIRDTSGDEDDGRDEVLCPLDCDTNGYIVDDYLKKNFIDRLPSNVNLVLMIDACHSGTAFDLKYNMVVNNSNTYKMTRDTHSKCSVVMISGCTDLQTSADAYIMLGGASRYTYQGAMTASFLANFKLGISSRTLVQNMRDWLKKNGYTQVPQLSSGKLLDILGKFPLNDFNN